MAQVQCEVEEGSVNSPCEATPSEIFPETLIATLPTREGWSTPLILYKKFWFRSAALRSLILAPAKFVPRHDDTILATHPKSGTTWLKALAFTVANRHRYTFADHPLLTRIPQDVVPFLEIKPGGLDYVEKMPSPRLISTHCPFSVLPPGISSSGCRIVYLCREPKDTFVSRWHFERSMCKADPIGINDAFNLFYEGCTPYGPFWNHNLEYWKESLMRPKEVMFVRYEEIFSDPLKVVRELASFLGVPFTEDEEEGGVVDQVVRFCSIESLRNLDVNKTGGIEHAASNVVIDHSSFFRKGKVGDWVNHMGKDMAEKLDRLVEDKFKGSGLDI
uniref:Uncharacterized protein n=1 Tax=Avena sativa TaxID=4498 RepID=A0ACD5TRJ9_AVESA